MTRRCLDCPTLIPQGSRCPAHQRLYRTREQARRGAGWEIGRTKQRILARDGGCVMRHDANHVCAGPLELDHIVPIADGGENPDSNLRILCRAAHQRVTTTWRRAR